MKIKAPAFQFYAREWRSSTAHMTLTEKGVYIDLLAWSWDNGPLPNSLAAIARIAAIDLRTLGRIWPRSLAQKWHLTRAGFLNRRLERQRRELRAFLKRQSLKGQRGAAARWDGQGNAPAMPRPSSGHNRAMALHSALCSTDPDPQDQDPRFAHLPKPRAARDGLAVVRKHLQAAIHGWLDQTPDLDDAELIARVKDLGRPLGFTWQASRELAVIIDGVRGQRARRQA